MHDREDEIAVGRGTLYCELHDRYYRSDTGCVLCALVRGDSIETAPVSEVKIESPPVIIDKCHYCGEDSLAWNPGINMYECRNPSCKRRISRFTKMGVGELLNDTPRAKTKTAVTEDDARAVTRNFAVVTKRPGRLIEEDDYDNDIVLPYDAKIAGYSKSGKRVINKQLATIKSMLIFLAFICFALAVWAVLLLVTAEVSPVTGVILLAAVCGILIWNVYGIMSFKAIGLGLVVLLFFVIMAIFVLCAAAGIEPFSSIGSDMLQFS
ncbi:MAG: hypothetical protein PHF74_00375 [Dehalococcoidales bacterium]|nr:hypothetical protein [Dehalococcoidales bacterium]